VILGGREKKNTFDDVFHAGQISEYVQMVLWPASLVHYCICAGAAWGDGGDGIRCVEPRRRPTEGAAAYRRACNGGPGVREQGAVSAGEETKGRSTGDVAEG
jgi:hypothetical protein